MRAGYRTAAKETTMPAPSYNAAAFKGLKALGTGMPVRS